MQSENKEWERGKRERREKKRGAERSNEGKLWQDRIKCDYAPKAAGEKKGEGKYGNNLERKLNKKEERPNTNTRCGWTMMTGGETGDERLLE